MNGKLLITEQTNLELLKKEHIRRRSFFRKMGALGLSTAAVAALSNSARADPPAADDQSGDTAAA